MYELRHKVLIIRNLKVANYGNYRVLQGKTINSMTSIIMFVF